MGPTCWSRLQDSTSNSVDPDSWNKHCILPSSICCLGFPWVPVAGVNEVDSPSIFPGPRVYALRAAPRNQQLRGLYFCKITFCRIAILLSFYIYFCSTSICFRCLTASRLARCDDFLQFILTLVYFFSTGATVAFWRTSRWSTTAGSNAECSNNRLSLNKLVTSKHCKYQASRWRKRMENTSPRRCVCCCVCESFVCLLGVGCWV